MERLLLNDGWTFVRGDAGGGETNVALPHGAFVATPDGGGHWFGVCVYRRRVRWEPPGPRATCALFVEAAMHTAVVVIDGREVGRHVGGYLPFEVDVTTALADGREHELAIRVDNRPTPQVPPGKPFEELDFCWYGGLYRGVELRTYPAVHITDAVAANQVAGGGLFFRTLAADEQRARAGVQVHVCNADVVTRELVVEVSLQREGQVVRDRVPLTLPAGAGRHVFLELEVAAPALWSPDAPHLYRLEAVVQTPDGGADRRTAQVGLRRIEFSRSGGFRINGRRHRLRGTNRHQEHPGAGYAVPAAADVRDARRIKAAGFDYVRLSHYPQSPAFLDACDELGIVVMNAIPGWQFLGDEVFRRECCQAARDLIRRDRNHPCVVLWELSLNETAMDEGFMAAMQALGHEEYPGDQMFTCGWIDRFDVFIHSRQHGELHRWRNGDRALVVAEYGDWEYHAANEGFDQRNGSGVMAAWASSRQSRGGGERALLQQAWNHVAAASDCLASPAVLDGQWAMFDYARGSAPQRARCGLMDAFRLPKFSSWFYRSQRSIGPRVSAAPMVFIASHWRPDSALRLTVFSNCEEVEVRLNGASLGRQRPEAAWMSQHLPHPPFIFDAPRFEAGRLEAVGYCGGVACARHVVATPGAPAAVRLVVDDQGHPSRAGEPDLLFIHAEVTDEAGTLCVESELEIQVAVDGGAVIGPDSLPAEAGIASFLVRVPAESRALQLTARARTGWVAVLDYARTSRVEQTGGPQRAEGLAAH